MPALCDTNILLALCYDRHIHHRAALAWLDGQNERAVVLCRMIQLSLLRLLNNATVMGEDVCSQSQAWVAYDRVLADERFVFQTEPPYLEPALRRLTQANTVSPHLWQDAYLAAFAMASGQELVSFDRGFQSVAGLRLILLA